MLKTPALNDALALTAGQSMAANTNSGVGNVIKQNPPDLLIAKDKSDEKGMVEFSGLEPGA